jgi:hypothetical protein
VEAVVTDALKAFWEDVLYHPADKPKRGQGGIVVSSFFPNVFGLNGRTNESQSTVQLPMTANFRGKAHFPLEKLLILICYQDEPKCAMNRSWHDHEE